VTELKIDKSFVAGMHEGDGGSAVVRAAAALGRDLGIAVVAEGVETPAECRRVRELGCHYAQGYLFGRPAPAGELAERLRSLQAPQAEGARVVALGGVA
jgi:EAL domain-containing protein (putative c-di-GMP-specific phosphodiesterase class I)